MLRAGKTVLAVGFLVAIMVVPAAAQAEPPKWYVGASPVTGSMPVTLKSKLSFHYTGSTSKEKFVSKCMTTAEGTISNSGAEGAGVDELTQGTITECVTTPRYCQEGVSLKMELNFNSPWPSNLVAGVPIRDEMLVNEVAVFCLGRNKSSRGYVSPIVKTGGLTFDKGHGELLSNGGITITGTWKFLPVGKLKISAK